MNLLIASDLHGSAPACRKLLDIFAASGAERLILLGDLLYHGPRNDLPEGYDPKAAETTATFETETKSGNDGDPAEKTDTNSDTPTML